MTALKTRTLGKSGIDVTEIGMGLWAAGGDVWGPTNDQAVLDAIDSALDTGITFTADVCGSGHSEELLGQAMRGRCDHFIIATKIGWQNFDSTRGQTAYDNVEKLIAGAEGNRRRLQTDSIDVLQSHINERDPAMEVFLAGFQGLQKDGKTRPTGSARATSPISSTSTTMGTVRPSRLTTASCGCGRGLLHRHSPAHCLRSGTAAALCAGGHAAVSIVSGRRADLLR
jgi:aryl-alcohol dehydrogenase-like predicted oxidoreductase